MTHEIETLSRRLVACIDLGDLPDGWRTCTTHPGGYPQRPAGTLLRVDDFEQLNDAVTEGMFGPIPEYPHHNLPEDMHRQLMEAHDQGSAAAWASVLPDLTDAATLGCVEDLLRARTGGLMDHLAPDGIGGWYWRHRGMLDPVFEYGRDLDVKRGRAEALVVAFEHLAVPR